MLGALLSSTAWARRSFDSLSEEEILALAIEAEEEDARIYLAYADNLRDRYPASAKVFEEMAEVEQTHKNNLIETFRSRFGEKIPHIRREHVRGFHARRPDWLARNLPLDTIRGQATEMEKQAARFYTEAAKRVTDASTRRLLGDLALAEQGHEEIAGALGEACGRGGAGSRGRDGTAPVHPDLRAAGTCGPDGRLGLHHGADFCRGIRDAEYLVDLPDRAVGLGGCGHFHGLYGSRS